MIRNYFAVGFFYGERDKIERILDEFGYDRFGISQDTRTDVLGSYRGLVFERDTVMAGYSCTVKTIWWVTQTDFEDFIRMERVKSTEAVTI
jgi:hypothetical protein